MTVISGTIDVAEGVPPDDPALGRPLTRAVVTYSWPSCSSMKLRVIRAM